MKAHEYIASVREQYVSALRRAVQKTREEGEFLGAEVTVQAQAPPGEPPMNKTLTFDILAGTPESPRPILLINQPQEGPLVGAVAIEDGAGIEVAIYPFLWEACRVWFKHPEPDWDPLKAWFARWFQPQETTPDDDGLSGMVHDLSDPIAEGGGYLFEVDLGSAPVAAYMEMLETLAQMGATEVRVGFSDGSDMDAVVADELRTPQLTPARFTELVAELLRGLEEVESVDSPEPLVLRVREAGISEPTMSDLHNLWLILQRAEVAQRPRFVGQFLRERRESHAFIKSGAKPDLASLRPVIKPAAFIEHIRSMELQRGKRPGETPPPAGIPLVCTRLVGDLWIACVWDRPNGMQFVLTGEPDEFGLSPDETFARALQNYLDSHPPVETTEEKGVILARTHDNYDATLLLDNDFWEKMRNQLPGTILACVPTRDMVLVTSTGTPGGEEALRAMAREHVHSGNHPISTTVLRREENTWAVHEKASAKPRTTLPEHERGGEPARRPWWKFW